MRLVHDATVTADQPAVVLAFAQSETSDVFVTGIDRSYDQYLRGTLRQFLRGIPDIACAHFRVKGPEAQKQTNALKTALDEAFRSLERELRGYLERNAVRPFMEAVQFLDKEDAAVLAESLVSLTALKRRVSLEVETVGRPIDVAFVSRSDGFVWIRRKHYFRPELNPFFFQKYLTHLAADGIDRQNAAAEGGSRDEPA
jgi:hypothetical protein